MTGVIIAAMIIAGAVALKAYLARNNVPVAPAVSPTPAVVGAATAPTAPTPPPPTGWEAFKAKASGFWKTYWKDSIYIPVTVFTVIIHLFIWELYPTWIWEPMKRNLGAVALIYLVYVIAITALKDNKVWKTRTANWTMILCVVMLTTKVFEITPWFGEEWHIVRLSLKAEKLKEEKVFAEELAIASFLPKDPDEVVIAPVGRKSRTINVASGPRIDAEGKIFVFVDDNPRPLRAGPDVKDFLFPRGADTIRIMSRSGKEERLEITYR